MAVKATRLGRSTARGRVGMRPPKLCQRSFAGRVTEGCCGSVGLPNLLERIVYGRFVI